MSNRSSWIEAQVHIHRHSPFGAVYRIYGWTLVSWSFAGRSCTVAIVEDPELDAIPTEFEGDYFIETSGEEHIDDEAPRGFELAYELPGHEIPVDDNFLSQFRPADGFWTKYVDSDEDLENFAWVQDQAYTAVYDYPEGLGKSFYVHPESVQGDNVIAAIMYDCENIPCRVAYAIRADGIAQGVGGAVIPKYRGQHLGEALWNDIGTWVREAWGLNYVFHVSMPCAAPIMARHNFKEVSRYRRWKRVAR